MTENGWAEEVSARYQELDLFKDREIQIQIKQLEERLIAIEQALVSNEVVPEDVI